MRYDHYDSGDGGGNEPGGFDFWFQRFLYNHFSERTARCIYNCCISLVAFLCKIGLFLTLPFKFVQFWIEEYRKQNKK